MGPTQWPSSPSCQGFSLKEEEEEAAAAAASWHHPYHDHKISLSPAMWRCGISLFLCLFSHKGKKRKKNQFAYIKLEGNLSSAMQYSSGYFSSRLFWNLYCINLNVIGRIIYCVIRYYTADDTNSNWKVSSNKLITKHMHWMDRLITQGYIWMCKILKLLHCENMWLQRYIYID